MNKDTVLCACRQTLEDPSAIGLFGEDLYSQEWLHLFSNATGARSFLTHANDIHEVWVASSDDLSSVNLAAALKWDNPDKQVYLIAADVNGSLNSRVHAAGIDGLMTLETFRSHYTTKKSGSFRPTPASGIRKGSESDFQHSAAAPGGRNTSLPEVPRGPRRGQGEVGSNIRCVDGGDPFSDPTPIEVVVRSDAGRRNDERLPSVKSDRKALPDSRTSAPRREATPYREAIRQTTPVLRKANAAARVVSSHRGYVLAVASGAGGTGKSSIAALCAILSHKSGFKTLLIDADMQFGDERFLFDSPRSISLADVGRNHSALEQLDGSDSLPALIAAPEKLEDSEVLSGVLCDVIEWAKTHYDVIIVNTGAFWAEQHAVILERATQTLFLLDQRPSSLRGCRHAMELCRRCGIPTNTFVFALNRCCRGALFTSMDVSSALQGALVYELSEGGNEVGELLGSGAALRLSESDNIFVKSLRRLLSVLLDELGPGAKGNAGISQKARRRKIRPTKRKRGAACL